MELVGDISSIVAACILFIIVVLVSVGVYKAVDKYDELEAEFDTKVEKAVDFLRNISKAYAKPPLRLSKRKQTDLVEDMPELCQSLLPFAHMCQDIYEKDKHGGMLFNAKFIRDGWKYKFHSGEDSTFAFLYKAQQSGREMHRIVEMILCIQGTNSTDDVVADLQATQVSAIGERYTHNGKEEFCTLWYNKFIRDGNQATRFYPKGVEDVQFHKGFHDRAMALIDVLSKILDKASLYMDHSTTIVCTGHSLGGAIATIMGMVFSMLLRDSPTRPPAASVGVFGRVQEQRDRMVIPIRKNKVHVVTFGAPRCLMDRKQKKEKVSTIKQLDNFIASFKDALVVVRVQNTFDPVPHTPMKEMGTDKAMHMSFYFIDVSILDHENLSYCKKKAISSQAVQVSVCERDPPDKGVKKLDLENVMRHAPFLFRADTHTMGEYVKRLQAYLSQNYTVVTFKRQWRDCYPNPPMCGTPCFIPKAIDVMTEGAEGAEADEEQGLVSTTRRQSCGYSCMIENIIDHASKLSLFEQ
jgi:hypothetical protein